MAGRSDTIGPWMPPPEQSIAVGSLTTVGYGDIVPKTETGRWAAVVIMITGIAVLGTLAGSLASFFRLGNGESSDSEPATTTDTPNGAALAALATEMTALRRQVDALTERLAQAPPNPPQEEPVPRGDASG